MSFNGTVTIALTRFPLTLLNMLYGWGTQLGLRTITLRLLSYRLGTSLSTRLILGRVPLRTLFPFFWRRIGCR